MYECGLHGAWAQDGGGLATQPQDRRADGRAQQLTQGAVSTQKGNKMFSVYEAVTAETIAWT